MAPNRRQWCWRLPPKLILLRQFWFIRETEEVRSLWREGYHIFWRKKDRPLWREGYHIFKEKKYIRSNFISRFFYVIFVGNEIKEQKVKMEKSDASFLNTLYLWLCQISSKPVNIWYLKCMFEASMFRWDLIWRKGPIHFLLVSTPIAVFVLNGLSLCSMIA